MTECYDKDNPGQNPGQNESIRNRKPERIFVYGNGFLPSKSNAEHIVGVWLSTNQHLFGNDATDDVPTEIIELPWIPYNNFDETIRTFRQQYRGRIIDSQNLIFYNGTPINNTCPAILLITVWPASKSEEIRSVIKTEAHKGKKVDYNRMNRQWWQFWK